jgi:hypothetical protein
MEDKDLNDLIYDIVRGSLYPMNDNQILHKLWENGKKDVTIEQVRDEIRDLLRTGMFFESSLPTYHSIT